MTVTKTEIISLFIGCFTGAGAVFANQENYILAAMFVLSALIIEFSFFIPAKRTEKIETS